MNQKIILTSALILCTAMTASCTFNADVKNSITTAQAFLDSVKSQNTDTATGYCTEEFREKALSYFDAAADEAALSFPAFLRDDVKAYFDENMRSPLISSISYGKAKSNKHDDTITVDISIEPENGLTPDLTISETDMHNMLIAAFNSDTIEDIITDYASISGMTFTELLTKYSQTSIEDLQNDIFETIKPASQIFANNLNSYIFKDARFYFEKEDGSMKIANID